MESLHTHALGLLFLSLLGCDETGPDLLPECGGTPEVQLDRALRTESGSVRVDGYAIAAEGTAIRAITVDGVAATPQSFNFSRFSVVLDEAQLAASSPEMCPEASEGQSCLRVLVATSCGAIPEAWRAVAVRGASPPTLTLSAPRWVVPADGSAGVTVQLESTTGNTPASLELLTPVGSEGAASFAATGSETARILDLDPSATTIVYGRAEGIVVLDATADRAAPVRQIVTVAGAPRFSPAAAEMPLESTLRFEIRSDAALDRCQSFGDGEVTVDGIDASLGVPLDAATAVGEFYLPAGATESTTVRCWDEFGQRSDALYRTTGAPP